MSPMVLMVVSNVLNFVILAFLLGKFVLPRIVAMMNDRQKSIAATIDEAEKNLADIQLELDAVRKEMQQAEVQMAAIREEAAQRGVAAAEKIKTDTAQEVEQLRQRVERQIEQEFSNLRVRLRQDLISQVVLKAEALISEQAQSNKDLQAQLVENFAFSLQGFKEYKS